MSLRRATANKNLSPTMTGGRRLRTGYLLSPGLLSPVPGRIYEVD